jgi:hypothetical protein
MLRRIAFCLQILDVAYRILDTLYIVHLSYLEQVSHIRHSFVFYFVFVAFAVLAVEIVVEHIVG